MSRRGPALAGAMRLLAGLTVGAAAAGAYGVGVDVGTSGSAGSQPPSAAETGPLRLDAYCRHLYGQRAAAYRPHRLEEWRCSAWRNGVWGLEEVDLAAACTWQAGPRARLTNSGTPGETVSPQLLCGV
jgi:hypothetical protein